MTEQVRRYDHVAAVLFGTPWAVTEEKLMAMVEVLELRIQGVTFTAEEIQARAGGVESRTVRTASGGEVAVLPLHGVIAPKANMITRASGGTSTEEFATAFRAAVDDPKVKAIVLDVDSPGGQMAGVPELADIIYGARGKKPILAAANGEDGAASAAYLLASQADKVYASPSARVGSIGVVTAHVDRSGEEAKAGVKTTLVSAGKYKASMSPFEALSAEGRESIQMLVDHAFGIFIEQVARGRGITPEAVSQGYGEGRVAYASAALQMGMIDGVATLEEVIAMAGGQKTTTAMKATTSTQAGKGARAMDEKQIREVLGIAEDADIGEAIAALKAQAEAPPAAGASDDMKTELADAQKNILALQGEIATNRAKSQVEDAIKAGKLLPRQRDTAMKMALRDEKEFAEFLSTQPEGLVQFGEKGSAGSLMSADGAAVDLTKLEPTAAEVESAKQMGVWSPEYRVKVMRQKATELGVELPADFGKEPAKA